MNKPAASGDRYVIALEERVVELEKRNQELEERLSGQSAELRNLYEDWPPPETKDKMNLTQLAGAIMAQDAELQNLQRKCYLLEPIARAADELERWLGQNAGHSSDWPVQVNVDCKKEADMLAELLTELFVQLKPYRAEKKNERAIDGIESD